MAGSRVWFRQWLSGRDFAASDPVGAHMANHVYAIGDAETHECILVDPAYDIAGIVDLVAAEGMRVVGVLATHYHADHVGGTMMGHTIAGAAELVGTTGVPVHVHVDEVPWVVRTSGLSEGDLVSHGSGDVLTVGSVPITLLHTPGHTPGSQCFLVDGRLVAGDTLFLDGCGRTDLPGGDASQLYDSLRRLASLPDDTIVFPGHHYSTDESRPLGSVKHRNMVFKPRTAEEWLRAFG